MKICKMFFFVCSGIFFEPIFSSPVARVVIRTMTQKAGEHNKQTLREKSQQVGQFMAQQVENFQKKLASVSAPNSLQNHIVKEVVTSAPRVAQAVKTEAEQSAHASGFLNFPKNSTTNHITHNYNYAQDTWSTGFFTWLKEGGQKRSAGVGILVGGVGGYGLHAATAERQEKIIIVQAPASKVG